MHKLLSILVALVLLVGINGTSFAQTPPPAADGTTVQADASTSKKEEKVRKHKAHRIHKERKEHKAK